MRRGALQAVTPTAGMLAGGLLAGRVPPYVKAFYYSRFLSRKRENMASACSGL